MQVIRPSKLGNPTKGPPRLGSTLAVLQTLPAGGHVIVPPAWQSWSTEWLAANRRDDRIRVWTDTGGIHGALSAIPAGADVGIGAEAFADAHPETRGQVAAVLKGTRFKLLWA